VAFIALNGLVTLGLTYFMAGPYGIHGTLVAYMFFSLVVTSWAAARAGASDPGFGERSARAEAGSPAPGGPTPSPTPSSPTRWFPAGLPSSA